MNFNLKQRDIILGIVIVLLLFLLKCSHDSKKQINEELYLTNYNLNVMSDTLVKYKTYNGDLVTERTSLVTSLKDLKKYNDTLYHRVSQLSTDLKAKPKFYTKYKTKIVHDTIKIYNTVTQLSDSTYLVEFNHDTIYNIGSERHIGGKIYMYVNNKKLTVSDFTINKDIMVFDAEIIISEKDNNIVASVISTYPGFDVTQINSVTLEPSLHPALKKLNNKRFVVGPYVGIGLSSTLKISPQLGIGLTYKIISFK